MTRNLGLVSTLILVRLLEPTDFGLIALATAFTSTVDALSVLGVQDALMREQHPNRDMYDSAFGIGILRGLGTAAIIVACAWPVALFFNEPRLAVVLLALAAGTLLSAFENIGTVDFRRQMTFQKEFHLQVFGRVVGVVVTIVLAWIWQNYWALVIGQLASRFVRLGQSYVMSAYRPRFALHAWRSLIGFSLWTWAVTMVLQVRNRADSFIIGRAMTTANLAAFTVGQEIGSLPVTEMIEPLHRTLFSAFVLLSHDAKNPRETYLNVIETGFLLVLPVGVGISLIADPLVHLMLGERWLSTIPVVELLAVASTISIFGTVSDAVNAGSGNLRVNFHLYAISAAIRVPLLLILVASHGLWGAAMALTLSAIVDQALFLAVTMRQMQIGLGQLAIRLWRPALACGAMIAGLWSAGMAWTPTQVVATMAMGADMLVRAGVGALAYGAALTLLWFMAGRPAGAERYLLDMAGTILRRARV